MAKKGPYKPPPGISIATRTGRPKPDIVEGKDPDTGKRHSKGFAKLATAETLARRLAKLKEDEGKNILGFDPEKWRRFLAFEKAIGGIDNLDAAKRLWTSKTTISAGITLEAAVKSFLAEKDREGIGADSYKRYIVATDRLLSSFPGVDLDQVTDHMLTTWLDELRLPDGRPFKAISRNNWRTYLATLFNFFLKRRWIDHNPVDLVTPYKEEENAVGILTPDEGARLFDANKRFPFIGRLALEAFAGLRNSTARKIQLAHINFEERGLNLPGSILKTGKRFYVDNFPPNLWHWLEHTPAACWTMTPRQYQEAKRHAFMRANIEPPHNCLRHSFCTYHIANFKNVGETATLLCHTNLSMLNRFYRGIATETAGRAWFAITQN